MDWGGFGNGWTIRLRELEFSVLRMFRISREDPEDELPDVELPAGHQESALRREAARRMISERK